MDKIRAEIIIRDVINERRRMAEEQQDPTMAEVHEEIAEALELYLKPAVVWISADERLPPTLQSVLVHGEGDNEHYEGYGVAWVNIDGRWMSNHIHRVTHWVYLPAPPMVERAERAWATVLAQCAPSIQRAVSAP